jgi:hypothetical protein
MEGNAWQASWKIYDCLSCFAKPYIFTGRKIYMATKMDCFFEKLVGALLCHISERGMQFLTKLKERLLNS